MLRKTTALSLKRLSLYSARIHGKRTCAVFDNAVLKTNVSRRTYVTHEEVVVAVASKDKVGAIQNGCRVKARGEKYFGNDVLESETTTY